MNYQTKAFIRFLWLLCFGYFCKLFLVITSQEYSSSKSSDLNVTGLDEENTHFGLDEVVNFLLSKNITRIKAKAQGDHDKGCLSQIVNTRMYLQQENVSFSCEPLDLENCPSNYQR